MKVGVPKEVKNHEYRVALTPIGVHELTERGHEVFIEKGAGAGSQIPDAEYVAEGARVLDGADEVWGTADLVLKVKEPVEEEYPRMREGQTLFTFLHLAAELNFYRLFNEAIEQFSLEAVSARQAEALAKAGL